MVICSQYLHRGDAELRVTRDTASTRFKKLDAAEVANMSSSEDKIDKGTRKTLFSFSKMEKKFFYD